jgi:hypothetical protein
LYSYLTPSNHISVEFKNKSAKKNWNNPNQNDSYPLKNLKNNYNNNNDIGGGRVFQDNIKEKIKMQSKNNEIAEIHKELNKKKIDFAVAQKKIKELALENKKVQNINNIIVRDNRQLALKLKNFENNRYNKLEIENNNFYYISSYNKIDIKNIIKKSNLLLKILIKKEMSVRNVLYKYFYKYHINSKLLNIINEKNNKNTLIIENNNFIINNNILEKDSNIDNDKEKNIENRNKLLSKLIKRKNINLYMYRNIFEKWMLRSIIIKNKDFIKEKKKKKKEKFKQRKQRKLYGYYMEKNDKKNNDEDNDNSAESDDFDIEEKFYK